MNVISRTYKLFKVSSKGSGEKFIKEFNTNQEAILKIRSILGLMEFRKCIIDHDSYTGTDIYKDGKKIFVIHKELIYDI